MLCQVMLFGVLKVYIFRITPVSYPHLTMCQIPASSHCNRNFKVNYKTENELWQFRQCTVAIGLYMLDWSESYSVTALAFIQ